MLLRRHSYIGRGRRSVLPQSRDSGLIVMHGGLISDNAAHAESALAFRRLET